MPFMLVLAYFIPSAGCKFLVKSMFLQLSKSLFFPEQAGQLARSQTPKGDKAKYLGNGSGRGILRSGSSKAPGLENGFPSDEVICVPLTHRRSSMPLPFCCLKKINRGIQKQGARHSNSHVKCITFEIPNRLNVYEYRRYFPSIRRN